MTTYTLSRTSPKNTRLIEPGGHGIVAYEISSTYHLGGSDTTIKKRGQTLAVIHWKPFQRSTITWNDRTTTIKEIFPRSHTFSTSRTYTAPSGEQLKWKSSAKLHCVSVETGLNLATYDRTLFYLVRTKKSTLDITSNGDHLKDALVGKSTIFLNFFAKRKQGTGDAPGGTGVVVEALGMVEEEETEVVNALD